MCKNFNIYYLSNFTYEIVSALEICLIWLVITIQPNLTYEKTTIKLIIIYNIIILNTGVRSVRVNDETNVGRILGAIVIR